MLATSAHYHLTIWLSCYWLSHRQVLRGHAQIALAMQLDDPFNTLRNVSISPIEYSWAKQINAATIVMQTTNFRSRFAGWLLSNPLLDSEFN